MLKDELISLRGPEFYLAINENLKGWMEMCYNRTYLMLYVPETMLARTQELSDAQACEYHVLKTEDNIESTKLRFMQSNLFWAVVEDAELQIAGNIQHSKSELKI